MSHAQHQPIFSPSPFGNHLDLIDAANFKKKPNTALIMKKFYIPGNRTKSQMLQHKLFEWKCECGQQIYSSKVMRLDLADQETFQKMPGKKLEYSKSVHVNKLKGCDYKNLVRFKEMVDGKKLNPQDVLIERYDELKEQERIKQKLKSLNLGKLFQAHQTERIDSLIIENNQNPIEESKENVLQENEQHNQVTNRNEEQQQNNNQDNSLNNRLIELQQIELEDEQNSDSITYQELLSQNRKNNQDSLIEEANAQRDHQINLEISPTNILPLQENQNSRNRLFESNQNTPKYNSLQNISFLSNRKKSAHLQNGNVKQNVRNIRSAEKLSNHHSDGNSKATNYDFNVFQSNNSRSAQLSAKTRTSQERDRQVTNEYIKEENYVATNIFHQSYKQIRSSSFYSMKQKKKPIQQQQVAKLPLNSKESLLLNLQNSLLKEIQGLQIRPRTGSISRNYILHSPKKSQKSVLRERQMRYFTNTDTQQDDKQDSNLEINLKGISYHTFKVSNLLSPLSSSRQSERVK